MINPLQVTKGGYRTAATSKMGFQPLTIITKCSILDVAAVPDPPLESVVTVCHFFQLPPVGGKQVCSNYKL